jgi:hypothetical protein
MATSVSIDSSYFPHLIDHILDEAIAQSSFSGLLRLRLVSHASKARADARLLDRVHLLPGENVLPPLNEVVRTVQDGRLAQLYTNPVDRERLRVNTLDIQNEIDYTTFEAVVKFLHPDTVRTWEAGDSIIPIMTNLQVRRHVHFSDLAMDTEEEMVLPESATKLVIHLGLNANGEGWGWYLFARPDVSCVKELVVIFKVRDIVPIPPVADDPPPPLRASGEIASGSLGPVLYLCLALWNTGSTHTLTLVDFPTAEQVNLGLFLLRPRAPWEVSPGTRQFQELFKQAVYDTQAETLPPKCQTRYPIEFIDLDTYAARVGVDELQMEISR